MKTLIELYDERPIENVLAAEVFRPERTVFLCPAEIAQSPQKQQSIRELFSRRGVGTECIFLETSLLYADKVERQLKKVISAYPDPAIEITGGSDAALFACGRLCGSFAVPVFTYSRKRGRFYDISNAPFARDKIPDIRYGIDDIFLMAGGRTAEGRVNNAGLARYADFIPRFFSVYRECRREWQRAVDYMQRASRTEESPAPLTVNAGFRVKGEHGSVLEAPERVLRALEEIGALQELRISGAGVSFTFADRQIRSWLRDVGSVLELSLYRQCLDSGLFQQVRTSVIVHWEGEETKDAVSNEIDVMAVRGIMPLFISCKTCAASTEALNELAILRDRFGGPMAKAVLATAQPCRAVTRHRAAELGITILDWEDLKAGDIRENLRQLTGA